MKKIWVLFTLVSFLVIIEACKKDEVPEGALNDKDLFNLIEKQNYSFYKGNDSRLPGANPNAHGSHIRTLFNPIAQSALDSNGVLPSNATFPDSSIVLKEVFDGENGPFKLYAVMMKLPNHPNQSGGWIWSEYEEDGKTIISIADKGNQCLSCHSAVDNRDLVRTFAFH
ncbi:MAG: cytochrome P460 family protein [Chitinophagales bacterium]